MDDETLEKLQRSKTLERNIQGVHCYDVLANPDYASAFSYVPADVPHRNLMIQDDDEDDSNDSLQSDLVKIALSLAMLKEQQAQKFSFQKEKAAQAFKWLI